MVDGNTWKRMCQTFGKNFLMGGLLLGVLSVIIVFIRPELAGHLSGAIPAALLFTLVYTYALTHDRARTANTARVALYGVTSWLVFCFVFYALMTWTALSFPCVLVLCLVTFVVMTYLIIKYVSLPEGFKLSEIKQ